MILLSHCIKVLVKEPNSYEIIEILDEDFL